MKKFKMFECGYCGKKNRGYIHPTHGQTFSGVCKDCGAKYISINGGETFVATKMGSTDTNTK